MPGFSLHFSQVKTQNRISQERQKVEKEDTLAVVVVPGEVEIRPVMVGCSGEPSSNLNILKISRDVVNRD